MQKKFRYFSGYTSFFASQSLLPKIEDRCHHNTPRILTLSDIYFLDACGYVWVTKKLQYSVRSIDFCKLIPYKYKTENSYTI
jgi:hypothetical protein